MLPSDVEPGHADLAMGLERVASLVRRLGPPSGISMTAAGTLHRLSVGGPCRVSELARLESVTQPAMTQLVGRLEASGYVERTGDPGDGRAVVVRITVDGERLLGDRRTYRAERLAALLAKLSADDRAAIAGALPALTRLAALA